MRARCVVAALLLAAAFGACAPTQQQPAQPPPILIVIAPPPPAPAGSVLAGPAQRSMDRNELATDWTGTWEGDSGYEFTFRLHLDTKGGRTSKDVEGYFEYTLTKAPDTSRLRWRVGESGREYVRGKWDPMTREVTLHGYRVDTPGFLATDDYRLQIGATGRTLQGKSRGNSYNWECVLKGRAVR